MKNHLYKMSKHDIYSVNTIRLIIQIRLVIIVQILLCVTSPGLNPIKINLSFQKFSDKNLRILNPHIFSENLRNFQTNISFILTAQYAIQCMLAFRKANFLVFLKSERKLLEKYEQLGYIHICQIVRKKSLKTLHLVLLSIYLGLNSLFEVGGVLLYLIIFVFCSLCSI